MEIPGSVVDDVILHYDVISYLDLTKYIEIEIEVAWKHRDRIEEGDGATRTRSKCWRSQKERISQWEKNPLCCHIKPVIWKKKKKEESNKIIIRWLCARKNCSEMHSPQGNFQPFASLSLSYTQPHTHTHRQTFLLTKYHLLLLLHTKILNGA